MQIVLLDEARFDAFAQNHPNKNFFQSTNYGRMMNKQGHNAYYLGLVDDFNNIKAATLLIVKNEKNDRRKMGYAPRGFLINWEDSTLVEEFTNSLKNFLLKRSFTYIKVDPLITYKTYDINGNEKTDIQNNIGFVPKLQSLGYIHLGYNDGLEASVPRWNAITKLDTNIVSLYNTLSKSARKKIKESSELGNKVYKGSSVDINLFYTLLDKPNPPIEFYLDYYQFFGNDFELYFTKLEPAAYVNSSKSLYEKEEQINNKLNTMIQSFDIPNKEQIIIEKMESDQRLAKYKKDMQDAITQFQNYPNGIMTATAAVLKHNKTVTILAYETNKKFKNYYSGYLLKWQLIQKFAQEGYEIIDFNGLEKDYNKNEKYLENVELSNNIVEYVGEFDLVINKKSYYTGSKLNPILNWLNTPI